MKLLLLCFAALIGLLSSCTEPTPVHVSQSLCSDQSEQDEACWIELSDQTGCYVQLPASHAIWGVFSPGRDCPETLTWTGECVEGLAEGTGTLEWTVDMSSLMWKHTGHLQAGKYHGEWKEDHTFGSSAGYYVGRGSYVEGVRHGQWHKHYSKGFFEKGPYVAGKKHGHWIEGGDDRHPHIGVERSEGWYVEGEKHGLWRITTTRTKNFDYEELEEPEITQREVRYVNGQAGGPPKR